MLFIEAIKTPPKFIALALESRRTAASRSSSPRSGATPPRAARSPRIPAASAAPIPPMTRCSSATASSAPKARRRCWRSPRSSRASAVPRGNRIAIISATGGTAAWLTDTCEAHGLALPEIDADRQQQLRTFIPAFGSARNPVDITAQGLSGYASSLRVLADAPEIDAFILPISLAQEVRIAREGEAIAAIARACGKPVLIYSYTAASQRSKELLRGWDFYAYARMAGCARALQAGLGYHRFQEARLARVRPATGRSPPAGTAGGSSLRAGGSCANTRRRRFSANTASRRCRRGWRRPPRKRSRRRRRSAGRSRSRCSRRKFRTRPRPRRWRSASRMRRRSGAPMTR